MKHFELSNHLGNVIATVSDRLLSTKNASSGTIASFSAEIISYADYYPFGMMMSERYSTKHRYGFNGMEKDEEFTNSDSHYDFGARIYDSRIGRWMSMDIYDAYYPSSSSYSFALNNPIVLIDQAGYFVVNPIELKGTEAVDGVHFEYTSASVTYIYHKKTNEGSVISRDQHKIGYWDKDKDGNDVWVTEEVKTKTTVTIKLVDDKIVKEVNTEVTYKKVIWKPEENEDGEEVLRTGSITEEIESSYEESFDNINSSLQERVNLQFEPFIKTKTSPFKVVNRFTGESAEGEAASNTLLGTLAGYVTKGFTAVKGAIGGALGTYLSHKTFELLENEFGQMYTDVIDPGTSWDSNSEEHKTTAPSLSKENFSLYKNYMLSGKAEQEIESEE